MPDLYFEDLTPGREFDLGSVTIDRDEMIAFAQRFDPQPFHVDEQAGKESIFGQLAASGWYTSSLWMRAYVDHVLARAASLGSPGGDELVWPAPVFAGDELTFSLVIADARRSKSRPTSCSATSLNASVGPWNSSASHWRWSIWTSGTTAGCRNVA